MTFWSRKIYPQFSILDPETTFSLPEKQTANGIVDAFIHVNEHYTTTDINTPLQDGFAEAILRTLIAEGPKVLADPNDYDARANIMWCAVNALNDILNAGIENDWASHMIGHEITAFHGIDHGQTLAVIWPNLADFKRNNKHGKLLKFARNVWKISDTDENTAIDSVLQKTKEFFKSIGMATTFGELGIDDKNFEEISSRLASRGPLGENGDIGKNEIQAILKKCL